MTPVRRRIPESLLKPQAWQLVYAFVNTHLYRLLWLGAVLLWVVVFNPKAESPTFVIAATGAVLWFVVQSFRRIRLGLLILVFVFSVLSPTDLFPAFLREQFVRPYALMVLPCILTWAAAMWLLLRAKPGDLEEVFAGNDRLPPTGVDAPAD